MMNPLSARNRFVDLKAEKERAGGNRHKQLRKLVSIEGVNSRRMIIWKMLSE